MLTEVFEVADRITVMRDGKCQGTTNASDINIDEIIRMMVGRKLEKHEFESTVRDEVVLDVKSLRGSRFHNINFSLRKGEILSLVGLAGAGRTEVAMAIFGADKSCTGEIYVEGKKVQIGSPLEAIKNGIGYLPEDRKLQGLFLEMSIEENVVSGNLKRIIKRRFIDKRRISAIAEEYKEKLHIAAPSIKGRVINLSGGNQQKVVIAKWLLVNPKILIVDEPTRGVDVGAKQEIYEILRKLASDGTAILMISSELPEAMLLSDRMLVMWNGEVTGELRCGKGHAVEEEEIMRYASGL
ncbi:MAG: sugar ABC transporter ATP-binding protein [[Clostridium] scindens]